MSKKSIKTKVLSSLFWKFMERSGTQGIQFIVQIVLARLLMPEQFGTIAIVMVFISLARV
ncbi:MAG: oligosaccharide flippase family protein, partial [Epulopiscium sp.]|nr:oligosaccharide flippase family protein [Candidatus Epulonipiscium sp.]